jgi:hypothetical protein
MNVRRLKLKKEEQEDTAPPVPTLADEIRALAAELSDFPELRLAAKLDALADRHVSETTYPGRPIPPEICEKLRGFSFQLRQLRSTDVGIRNGLENEAKRLERTS